MKTSDMPLLDSFRYMVELPYDLGLRLCTMSNHDLTGWIGCFQLVKPSDSESEAWKRWISTPEELDKGVRALQKAAAPLIAALTVSNGTTDHPLRQKSTQGTPLQGTWAAGVSAASSTADIAKNFASFEEMMREQSKYLTYPTQGTWVIGNCEDPRGLIPGPPGLVEVEPGADLVPAWDLALIRALQATGKAGKVRANRIMEEAIGRGAALYQGGCERLKNRSILGIRDPWELFITPKGAPQTGPVMFRIGRPFIGDVDPNPNVFIEEIRSPEALCARAWRELAWLVWLDQIKEDWEHRNRKPVVAWSAVATAKITELLKTEKIKDDCIIDSNGKVIAKLQIDATGPIIADSEALRRTLWATGKSELTRLAGPRFLIHFAERVQRRAPDEWTKPVEWSGWSELSEKLNMEDNTKAVRALIELLSGVVLQYADSSACSLFRGYEYLQGRYTRSGYVRLTPGAPWLGDQDPFMRDLKDRGAHNRSLVALVALPAPVGHRDHASQARLFLGGVLPALAEGSIDLAIGRGVHLPPQWWLQQAGQWGVPGPLLIDHLRAAWSTEDGPLVEVSKDRYHLSERYKEERELLENGGKIRRGGSKGAQTALKNKRRMQGAK